MTDKVYIHINDKERVPIGLEDGGHHIIKCSNCYAPLVDIWVTRPNLDVEVPVLAKCPFCNDKSYINVIKGGFHTGPAFVDKSANYDENGTNYVELGDAEFKDDVIIFNTKKVKEWK